MSSFEFLSTEVDGAVATVRLARSPVNSVNQHMYREIHALFADIGQLGPTVKVVVLTGEGRHFCAGNDLNEFATLTPDNCDDRMVEVRSAFFAVQDCPVPVIAAVHGAALGTGLALAASCDFVIASDDARFGTPEVAVGIMGGARHLARLVPQSWVRLMYFTADPLSAHEMAALGGVIAVVPQAELLTTARTYADRVTRHSHALLRMAKKALNQIESMELQTGYAFEQSMTTKICAHPDSVEAVRAAIEHRPPAYRPVAC